jgi:hypothetical protein
MLFCKGQVNGFNGVFADTRLGVFWKTDLRFRQRRNDALLKMFSKISFVK